MSSAVSSETRWSPMESSSHLVPLRQSRAELAECLWRCAGVHRGRGHQRGAWWLQNARGSRANPLLSSHLLIPISWSPSPDISPQGCHGHAITTNPTGHLYVRLIRHGNTTIWLSRAAASSVPWPMSWLCSVVVMRLFGGCPGCVCGDMSNSFHPLYSPCLFRALPACGAVCWCFKAIC